jgi:hypothetical protein
MQQPELSAPKLVEQLDWAVDYALKAHVHLWVTVLSSEFLDGLARSQSSADDLGPVFCNVCGQPWSPRETRRKCSPPPGSLSVLTLDLEG